MKMNKDYRSYTLDQSFSANNLRFSVIVKEDDLINL